MDLLDKLEKEGTLSAGEFLSLYRMRNAIGREKLFARARRLRDTAYGRDVYLRALVECTSFCRCGCLYCGINASNRHAVRYRLSPDEVIDAAGRAYRAGFRTFVLQGGEDAVFVKDLSTIIRHLKDSFPDAAVTLSFGEWPEPLYAEWKEAGADRYLLRHETATAGHFARLHPAGQTLEHRLSCLQALRRLGYQTGAGFMVGSPFQSEEDVARDLAFLSSFRPEMAGIGPFIPHHDTVFASCGAGSVDDTLFILALMRIAMPNVLLPATTALATLSPTGTRDGILAGANVVMPNMTPAGEGRYELYDGKKRQDAGEAMRKEIEAAGCRMAMVRGDYRD